MTGITAIILTFNEEKHIARCLSSLQKIAERTVVVDSFSSDRTIEIARSMGADVFQNPFENHASQFQWAIENTRVESEWTMRVDADEYIELSLQDKIEDFCRNPGAVNAVYFRRKIVFLGRPITHGFFYPNMTLRLWRTGQGKMEARWMDEHIIVNNPVVKIMNGGDLVDFNLNDLAWWTAKHVGYAKREVYEIVRSQYSAIENKSNNLAGRARQKRWIKDYIYNRMPLSLRAFLYFIYRYVCGAGFLDGREGFLFHFLQAFWYRVYVDATLVEMEKQAHSEGQDLYVSLSRRGIIN